MPGPFKCLATAYQPTTGGKFGSYDPGNIVGPLSGFFYTPTALVSGTDYYISDNYLSAFIAYPSEIANSITTMTFDGVQGGYRRPVNWVDFSLLSGLQVINASYTQSAPLSNFNLFAHPNLQRIYGNENSYTIVDVRNCKNLYEVSPRINRSLQVLDLNGVSALNFLNIEACGFSAFDVYGGPEYTTPQLIVYARDNNFSVKDFNRCKIQTLTGIRDFYFRTFSLPYPSNQYKQNYWDFSALSGVQLLNLDNNLFTSIEPQLMPARDTLRTFICSNNSLTSVSFNSQSQLNYLDVSYNTSNLLSSINITPLPGLTYLNCDLLYGLSAIFGLEAQTWNQPIQESRVFQIDAADPASYPGSGTTIYNLRSLPNAATIALQFNPSNAFGGAWQILNSPSFGSISYGASTWQQLGLNNNFTINMWLRLSSYPTESVRALFSTENYLQSGFRAFIGGSSFGPFPGNEGKIGFWSLESINSGVDGPGFNAITPTKIPLNTPVNFTFTVSPNGVGPLGVDAKVYVNGTLQVSTSGNFRAPWNGNISLFGVGGYNPAACELFLVEYMAGAQQQWQIGNRYNEYSTRFNVPRVVDIDTLLLYGTKLSALDLTKFSSLSTINFGGLTNLRSLSLPDPCKFTSFSLGDTQVTTLNLSSLINVDYLDVASNLNLSSLNLQGLTGITDFSTSYNNISTLDITSLSGLVDLTITEPTLTSLVKNNSYNDLINVLLNTNNLLQTRFNNNNNLRTFQISENYSPVVELNDNIDLQYIYITDDAAITNLPINDNPSLASFIYSGQTPVLSSLTFTNCSNVSSVSITNASLTNDNFLANLPEINTLSLTTCNSLSSISHISNNASLSSLTLSNCIKVNNVDSFNCPTLTVATLSILPISSVDAFINNNNSLRSVTVNSNNSLSTFRADLSQTVNLLRLNLSNNSLANDSIDYLLISLDANPNIPPGFPGSFSPNKKVLYSGNRIASRSTFSNAAYNSLFTKGWRFTPAQPSATLYFTPTPVITITLAPSALQFTQTATLLATATYLTSSIETFIQVLSGPGAMVNSFTLSALSGMGTVTMLVSSLSSNLFQPATATFDVQLQKLDASSNIIFSGLNKVYTGDVITASASVTNYPEISTNITYLQSNSAVLAPVAAGYYTVSASIDNDDNITGSSTAQLSVLRVSDYYTLPLSATSSIIYFPRTVDTEKDVVVTFDYVFYGADLSGSEGFCISFTDATAFRTPISGGAPGKALNYTNLTLLSTDDGTFTFENYPGKFKGSLGIGFDATGNFALTSLNLGGLPNTIPNSISIRDSAINNYSVLYRSEVLTGSSYKVPFNLYQSTTGTPTFKTVRVRLTNLGRKVLVDMKPTSTYEFLNYVNYDLPVSQPSIASIALSYSTGYNNPIFKIKNFNINCFFRAATATLADLFTASFTGPGTYGADGLTYTTSYELSLYYDIKTPTGLPYTMNLYINTTPVANVLFDPVYESQLFAAVNTLRTYYSYFVSGGNYLV
jgi:hypothetical protein